MADISHTTKKNIVILGGSFGGASVAHYLLKHAVPQLPDKETYQVVLVSASCKAMCRPACPRAMISDSLLPQDKLFVDLEKAFAHYPAENFRFVHGTATDLDHTNRTVSVTLSDDSNGATTQNFEYHALVIATGASTSSPLLGLNGSYESLKSNWSALRDALPNVKSIIIGGGGPSSVETAGELGEHLNGTAGWFSSKLENPKVPITVVTSGAQILPYLRPSLAEKAEGLLARLGVTVVKNSRVASVSPAGAGTDDIVTGNVTVTLQDGKTMETDLYIPAIGTRPNTSFVPAVLKNANGLVDANSSTLRVDKAGARVYAIGDASSYARPAIHIITEAVPVLCANIKRDLLLAAGKEEGDSSVPAEKQFKEDTRETQLVCVGRSKGVGVAMGYQLPSFLVWLIKGRDYWLWTTGPLWSGKQW
ncbi:hypothetical protein FQN51_007954 [Onygenales sp. PD_10]|nr:hypothetical protein FQN51_007954 [Onygenales sp. PD_10]